MPLFDASPKEVPSPAKALRATLAEGYNPSAARGDLKAGLATALATLPLGLGLAMASGVPPQCGLAAAVVAGAVTALAGGSRALLSGPSAAFAGLLLPIVYKHGLGGLLTTGLLAGLILLGLGLLGLGRSIERLPSAAVAGLTTGLALILASLELKDFLGLSVAGSQERLWDRLVALFHALPTFQPLEAALGLGTLGLIIVLGQLFKRMSAPVAALFLVAAAAALLKLLRPDLPIATLGAHFSFSDASGTHPGIPRLLGAGWPWKWNGLFGPAFTPTPAGLESLLPGAMVLALLAATETLLASAVSEGLLSRRRDPDGELIALGLANLACPFFGGIPAGGSVARSALAVRNGARSPLAALFQALFVAVLVLALAPLAAFIPLAALAALVLVAAMNLADGRRVRTLLRSGTWGERLLFASCLLLVLCADLVVALTAAFLLALLFLARRRGGDADAQRLLPGEGLPAGCALPGDTLALRLRGLPLFAEEGKALVLLSRYGKDFKTVILDASALEAPDAEGLRSLSFALRELEAEGRQVVLAASQGLREGMERSGWFKDGGRGPTVYASVEQALQAGFREAGFREAGSREAGLKQGKAPAGPSAPAWGAPQGRSRKTKAAAAYAPPPVKEAPLPAPAKPATRAKLSVPNKGPLAAPKGAQKARAKTA